MNISINNNRNKVKCHRRRLNLRILYKWLSFHFLIFGRIRHITDQLADESIPFAYTHFGLLTFGSLDGSLQNRSFIVRLRLWLSVDWILYKYIDAFMMQSFDCETEKVETTEFKHRLSCLGKFLF